MVNILPKGKGVCGSKLFTVNKKAPQRGQDRCVNKNSFKRKKRAYK
jgi:hypothetical protein